MRFEIKIDSRISIKVRGLEDEIFHDVTMDVC